MSKQGKFFIVVILATISGISVGLIQKAQVDSSTAHIIVGLSAGLAVLISVFILAKLSNKKLADNISSKVETGKVKWYDNKKSYGFIIFNGKEIFFHNKGLERSSRRPKENDTVEFVMGKSKKGDQAYHVKITSSAPKEKRQPTRQPTRQQPENKPQPNTEKKTQPDNKQQSDSKPLQPKKNNNKESKRPQPKTPQPKHRNKPKIETEQNLPPADFGHDENWVEEDGPQPGNSINEPPAHNKSSVDFNYRDLNYPRKK